MRKLEGLVRRFLDPKEYSIQELWSIQGELLNLQISLHEELAAERSAKRMQKQKKHQFATTKVGDWTEHIALIEQGIEESAKKLNVLEHVLKLAKKFGDAYATRLFYGNRNALVALGNNQASRTIPTGYSLDGMLAIAEELSNKGWGIPVIHDITNMLRVGDISFVLRGREVEPITVEVKTSVLSVVDGKAHLNVSVLTTITEDKETNSERVLFQSFTSAEAADPTRSTKRNFDKLLNNARVRRQFMRMLKAKEIQGVASSRVLESKENDVDATVVIQLSDNDISYNWEIARDVLVDAKKHDIAFQADENAILYFAMYFGSVGTSPWWSDFLDGYGSALQKLGSEQAFKLISSNSTDKERVLLMSYWRHFADGNVHASTPFFLYPIPLDLVIDMMWGRLGICVCVNINRLAEALSAVGLTAVVPTSEAEARARPIKVLQSVEVNSSFGRGLAQFELGSHEIGMLIEKVFFEFLSVRGFVTLVERGVSEMISLTPEMLETAEVSRQQRQIMKLDSDAPDSASA